MRNAFISTTLSCALALPLAACTQPMNEKNKLEYRENPNPTQAYQITMTIKDAPGDFKSIKGLVQYDVANRECLRPPKENPGGHSSYATRDIPFTLTKVSDGEYTGTVYADGMLDEDYYKRGVCHWKLTQARVHMKATGADGETLFIPSIPDEKLLGEESEELYFTKDFYPRTDVADLPYSGVDAENRNPNAPEGNAFTITLTSKRTAQ